MTTRTAPVYRNIDTVASVLGLALPYEAGAVGLVAVLGVAWAPPLPTALLTLALYVSLRVAGRGKPPGYLQNLVPFWFRRAASGGRFSAASPPDARPGARSSCLARANQIRDPGCRPGWRTPRRVEPTSAPALPEAPQHHPLLSPEQTPPRLISLPTKDRPLHSRNVGHQ